MVMRGLRCWGLALSAAGVGAFLCRSHDDGADSASGADVDDAIEREHAGVEGRYFIVLLRDEHVC